MADRPGPHAISDNWSVNADKLNNLVHAFNPRRAKAHYREGIDYSGTIYSQETTWGTRESRQNFNIWHSMRSPSEAEFGSISEKDAMSRGMEFGWSKVFESAQSGSLNDLKANSSGIQALGQGIHALQDAFAHLGTDTNNHSVVNDLRGDTSEAENITTSAITVHNLLSGNYDAFNGSNQVGFSTQGMNQEQVSQAFGALLDYFNSNNND